MRCSKCGAENPDEMTFCGQCTAALALVCPKCHSVNPPGFKFCGQCTTALALTDAEALKLHDDVRGERRHLTVLFCDLKDSTEISSHLDPEEWHNIAAEYQRNAADAVTRLGGHVAKYLGDGLVVFFGYPTAHEDDGERAVRAGLAIVDAIWALNDRLTGKHDALKLAVRGGIDAGLVVVGQGGGTEADVCVANC
jgi:class 3 adenylate cyclase